MTIENFEKRELDWQAREKCWRLDLEMERQRADALRDEWFGAEKRCRAESERVAHYREAAENCGKAYDRALGVVGAMEKSRDEWKYLARHRWDLFERAEKQVKQLEQRCAHWQKAAEAWSDLAGQRLKEIENWRSAKAQIELRLQAAEKECKELRERLAPKCDILGRDFDGKRFHECEKCK